MSKLQDRRKAAGLSQSQLAMKVPGLKLQTLQRYEMGDSNINRAAAETVLRIAKVLRCKPDDILE